MRNDPLPNPSPLKGEGRVGVADDSWGVVKR